MEESMQRFKRRPSAATVLAFVALMVALSGSAIATPVANIARQITGANIKNGTIKGADIKNGSLSGADIHDGSLGSADIGTFQVKDSEIAPDAIGGDKIKPDSIGGSDIIESTLAQVPSAAHADSADNAKNATTAGNGVAAYAHVDAATTPGTPVLDPARSSGFSAVRQVVDSEHYCMTPAAGVPGEGSRPAVANLDTTDTSIDTYTRVIVGAPDCNPGEYEITTPDADDENFTVIVG
jgi:hypothetical protein